MSYDAKQRRFTIDHPIHVDLYGGVVKIVATNVAYSLNTEEKKFPLLGVRYQTSDPNDITEMRYSLDGQWCGGKASVQGFDLWDADLLSIRPQLRVPLEVVKNVS